MSIFCNYNIPIFPMTFGALTMGAGGCSTPIGGYSYNSLMSTELAFNNTQPLFNFNNTFSNNTTTDNSSGWKMPWSGWFNNFSFNFITPQLSMPSFDFSGFKFKFGTNIYNSNSGDTFTRNYTGTMQQQLVQRASDYVGKVNSDAEGNRLFSGGVKQPWCADFVTKVTKDTYGCKLPSSFGSSGVVNLRSWAQNNNCYMQTENKSSTEKKEFIANNVKPGDIMIEQRGGKSHTGIVTKVYSDGSFDTVEGNTSNKVGTRHYTADSSTLSGFINLDKYST